MMAGPPPPGLELPEEVLAVLPTDPFEQLDVARKITSIALASRVSALEAEVSSLRRELEGKDDLVEELGAQVEALDATLSDMSRQLARADEEKESLLNENASLNSTVKKLNRDVSKLEVFRKTLMQSLQEEDESSKTGATQVVQKQMPNTASFSFGSPIGDEESTMPSSKLPPLRTQLSETGSTTSDDVGSVDTDVSRHGVSYGLLLASSLSTTPRLTPPDSPKKHSTAGSPKLIKPFDPRRHSISFASTRNAFEERSSVFSSMPSSHHSSISGSLESGSQTGRGRVDGKEFFRQVRSRLSYEQFSSFLTNVKEMNSHKQTREETLRKANEIFGPDNKDLYAIFEGLVTRNLH